MLIIPYFIIVLHIRYLEEVGRSLRDDEYKVGRMYGAYRHSTRHHRQRQSAMRAASKPGWPGVLEVDHAAMKPCIYSLYYYTGVHI